MKTAGSTPFAGREGALGESAADELARPWHRGRRGLAAGVVAAVVAAAAFAVGVAGPLLRDGDASQVKGNAVGMFDSESGKLASQVQIGVVPTSIAADRAAVWVTSGDDQSVLQIDPHEQAVVQTIRVGAGAAGVAIGAGAVWVANALDGTVSRIDPQTRTLVDTIAVGNSPTAIAYGLDGLWIVNRGDGEVVKLDPRTGKLVQTLSEPAAPTAIATGFGSLWVTSERAGTVSRIDPEDESGADDRCRQRPARRGERRGLCLGCEQSRWHGQPDRSSDEQSDGVGLHRARPERYCCRAEHSVGRKRR